jgi:hypothetical protein
MVHGADWPNCSVEQYQGKDGTWCRLPQTLPGARQTEAPRAVKSNLNSGILFPPSPPPNPSFLSNKMQNHQMDSKPISRISVCYLLHSTSSAVLSFFISLFLLFFLSLLLFLFSHCRILRVATYFFRNQAAYSTEMEITKNKRP